MLGRALDSLVITTNMNAHKSIWQNKINNNMNCFHSAKKQFWENGQHLPIWNQRNLFFYFHRFFYKREGELEPRW